MRLLLLAALAAVPLTALSARPAVKAPARAAVRAPVAVDWSRTIAPTPQGGMRMGNPNAPFKLIEYGSRTCPHCAAFDVEGLPTLKAGPIKSGKLSYEFRDYPVHGALDLAPILLGNCVPTARFFPVLDAMFANQNALLGNADSLTIPPNSTAVQIANLVGDKLGYVAFMKRFGMTPVQARACLSNPAAINRIAARTKFANDTFKIPATPSFILNGKLVANVYNWAALEPVLRAAGI